MSGVPKANKWSEVRGGERAASLPRVVRTGLPDKGLFEQKPEQGEGMSHGYLGKEESRQRKQGKTLRWEYNP